MKYFLSTIQVIASIALVVTILLQRRSGGGSAIFGGGGGGGSYYTKRGFEKIIFIASIVLAILFIVTSLLNLIV